MNRYTIYCTEEQTRKALELGAPIMSLKNAIMSNGIAHFIDGEIGEEWILYICPTAEQMIGFLRRKGIKFHFDDATNYWHISIDSEPLSIGYGTDKNKELAAIDAALEYLIKQKEE